MLSSCRKLIRDMKVKVTQDKINLIRLLRDIKICVKYNN